MDKIGGLPFTDSLPPRYRVERILSRGERWAVLQVFDASLRQAKAVLRVQHLTEEGPGEAADRDFRRFCARLASIRHPNAAVPYTFGTFQSVSGGTFGYATREFVSGITLAALPLPLSEEAVARIALQVCQGLDALHAQGIHHCDLKPENVVLRRASGGKVDEFSQCVLIDLAYRPDSAEGAPSLNEVTLQYVAPEMLGGQPPGPRTDLYALGVMLYRLLSGAMPFEGASLPEIMRRQRARDFTPLSARRPQVSAALGRTVEKLLEPNPDHRPENAQAVIALLADVAAGGARGAAAFATGEFVGREAELEECIGALHVAGPAPGAGSVAIAGARGSGVTAFLRELQDRLEAHGVAVLTAQPRAFAGVPLQEQIRDAVHALVRQSHAPAQGASRLGASETSTDLLDDLLVAAQERRVILFVDDWSFCDVAELRFLSRLVLQDRALLEGATRRSGRCQLVLGDPRAAGPEHGATGEMDRLVAKRIRLRALARDETGRIVAASGAAPFSRADIVRIHDATGGHPGRICALLRQIGEAGAANAGDALDVALAQVDRALDRDAESGIAALRSHPGARALLALALWGEELSGQRWDLLLARFGERDDPELPVERINRSGRTYVRSRHRHLADPIGRALGGEELRELGSAMLAVTRDSWRSLEPGTLMPLLRVAARTRMFPSRFRWHVCRTLIVLLDHGCFADVESAVGLLADAGESPWWLMAFREAARAAAAQAEEAGLPVVEEEIRTPAGFARAWIRARGLVRARYREEGYRIFRSLATSELPWARAAGVALAEDHAVAAVEVGLIEEAVRQRRRIAAAVARWLPFVRRNRDARAVSTARTRLRACRKLARYHRVRQRLSIVRRRYRNALAACRRERALARVGGDLLREASCLNNEGLILMQSGGHGAPVTVLERCVRLREKLDDERGLVIALSNLAAALSSSGKFGSAAAILNRARIVATRNGLGRSRNLALLSLGAAYGRRGQLRDAQRVFRQALRFGREEGDLDAYARAMLNCAIVAMDRWRPAVAEAWLSRVDRLREASAAFPRGLNPDAVRAELAARGRDWAHLHTLVTRMRARNDGGPEILAFEQRVRVESGESPAPRCPDAEHRCGPATRLRLLLLRRRGRRIPLASLARTQRYARRHACTREAVQLLIAHLGALEGAAHASIDLGLKALSWFEMREGHDDLQIELRAQLARLLRERGRHAEAWQLVEDALLRFRTLERRLGRWPRGLHLLLHLQERLRLALGGPGGVRATGPQRLSSELFVRAFDVLMDGRRRGIGTREARADVLLRVGAALGRGTDRDAFVDEVLGIALGVTGAQRAVLITGTPGAQRVRRTFLAQGDLEADERPEISWAVVSQVLASGHASFFSDALAAEELASHRSIATLRLRSLACVPLRASDAVLGVLYLDHHGIAGLFDDDMIGLLEMLAGLLALALRVREIEQQAHEARQELLETQRHILRAERNRLTGELAGGLVHDLKNMLAAISGRAQLLRRANRDPEVLRALDSIERATGSGLGLVQRLQECARDHSSQTEEPVDLASIARESVDLLAARLDKASVSAEVNAGGPGIVWGVPGEYREMLLNLLVNAIDAMPHGGRLEVGVAVEAEASSVVLTVADTGAGMSAETKARVFEPFFTTKGNHGTGLGLVVVRNVVVRHGGSISVESEEGKGTRFTVSLPRPRADLLVRRDETGAAR